MKLTIPIITFILLCSHYVESGVVDPLKILNFLRPKILNFVDYSLNGTACAADLKRFIDDLHKHRWWALRMLDASSKLHAGLLDGNMRLYGNYDQCLSVQNIANKNVVNGQYCTVVLTPNEKTLKTQFDLLRKFVNHSNWKVKSIDWNSFVDYAIYYYGLCVPQSCTVANLTSLWQHLENVFKFPVQAKFFEESCYYKDKQKASNSLDFYVFFFFAFILTVELVSTGYDIYARNFGKEPNIFVSLSLYTNTKRLLSTHCQNETLTCLYGIKVISMIWIIIGHIAVAKVYFSSNSSYAVLQWANSSKNCIFLAAPYAVDTFFSISGLLVVYVWLCYSRKMEINFLMRYLHRILRLVPALLATILFHISVIKYFFDGPFAFKALTHLKTNCEENWWATLFFVNNFVPLSKQCIPVSWYLSVDTHMYILSPILTYCMIRNTKKTFIGIFIICASSFIYTWTLVVRNNFGFIGYWEVQDDVATFTYLSTLCRMPTWLIGTYFGYLLYEHNVKKIQITKTANVVLWTLSLSIMMCLIVSQTIFFREEYNVYRSAFFNTFSRPLWSLSVCYIILSCCTGHGGPVNTFLSHPVFIVLGKLTYSMFLTHVTVIYFVIMNGKQPGYFGNFEIFFEFWGYLALTLISGTALCLVFEAPVVSFSNHLEARQGKKLN